MVKGKVIGAFVNWLYLGEFGKVVDCDDLFASENGQNGMGKMVEVDACTLIELWVLAGRLGAKTCQNDCIVGIEKLRKKNNTSEFYILNLLSFLPWMHLLMSSLFSFVVETGMLKWTYMNTMDYNLASSQCPLRNLLIDQCAWLLDEKWLMSRGNGLGNEQVFPRDALVDRTCPFKSRLLDFQD